VTVLVALIVGASISGTAVHWAHQRQHQIEADRHHYTRWRVLDRQRATRLWNDLIQ
jgi:type II secretory pathway component PulJ